MKVLIIGGGFAGLSAAYYSALHGYDVLLLESSSVVGGAWRPIKANRFNYPIDNGQHILSSTYTATLDFLRASGADKLFWDTGRLNVPFIQNSKKYKLNTTLLPSPFGELLGILLYRKLSLKSKISIINFMRRIAKIKPNKAYTAEEYLLAEKQSQNAIEYFWAPIIVSACNANPADVSAVVVYNMLMKIFGNKNIQSNLLIPKVPVKFILYQIITLLVKNDVEIQVSKTLKTINSKNGVIHSIETADGEIFRADIFIFATSLKTKEFILNESFYQNGTHYSGIVNAHFLYDRPIMKEKYVSLLGTNLQWVFEEQNAGEFGYLYKLTSSAAKQIIGKDSNTIKHIFVTEIINNFPLAKEAKLLQSQVIKEKFATPILYPQFQKKRPKTQTHYKNMFLAGAYVDTGLPITIESAVISGKMAAEAVKKYRDEHYSI
ncbi:MAG: hydroxysqualene dehydroxylase HpnE [bacterium]